MKRTVLTLCMVAGSLLLAQTAVAGTRVSISLGFPVVQYEACDEPPCEEYYYYEEDPWEYEDEVWVEGHYCVVQSRYVWVPGYWVPAVHDHGVCLRRPIVYRHYHENHGGPPHGVYRNPPKGSFHTDGAKGRPGYSRPVGTDRRGQTHIENGRKYGQGNHGYPGQGGQRQQGIQPQGKSGSQRHDGYNSGGNWMNNINNRVIKGQITQVRRD
jgi:hypothetical protein